MIQTVKAIIEASGEVRLLEEVYLDRSHRALVTVLDEEPTDFVETSLMSGAVLSVDWNRPEEEEAWSYLQETSGPSV